MEAGRSPSRTLVAALRDAAAARSWQAAAAQPSAACSGALFVAEVEDFVPFINLPNGGHLIAVGVLTVLALIVGTRRSGPRLGAFSQIMSLRK